jgi:hypothetical protein
MTGASSPQLFDAYYFQHGCGLPYEASEPWRRFFGQVADRIVQGIGPRTVLDAGCAIGLLVDALRARGVEAYGIDISEYAIGQVPEAVREYCQVGSLVEPLARRYDLIVCIEVLEHMQPAESMAALANLCQATDDIVFSSSPTDFREPTHFNAQPPEYWAGLFAEQGFVRDVDFDATVILPWSLRLRRLNAPLARVAADYERKFWRLAQENHELRQQSLEMRARLAALERSESQLQEVQTSLRWRLGNSLARWGRYIVPAGSWRERQAVRLLQALERRPAGRQETASGPAER